MLNTLNEDACPTLSNSWQSLLTLLNSCYFIQTLTLLNSCQCVSLCLLDTSEPMPVFPNHVWHCRTHASSLFDSVSTGCEPVCMLKSSKSNSRLHIVVFVLYLTMFSVTWMLITIWRWSCSANMPYTCTLLLAEHTATHWDDALCIPIYIVMVFP